MRWIKHVFLLCLVTLIIFYRRQGLSIDRHQRCACRSLSLKNKSTTLLCNNYSNERGFHQRIISISMYVSNENERFSLNASMEYLRHLIIEMKDKYPHWILRIYHDQTIPMDFICSIECRHKQIDFCSINELGLNYIPPKIWRFLPLADPLVDIIASRDLDSPLTQREVDAVQQWIQSNQSWHVMRDHPNHYVPMLGGLWAFRVEWNRPFAAKLFQKLIDRSLVRRYNGRGDQKFLEDHVWPYIQNRLLAHDSFLCTHPFGQHSHPWPTRRRALSNDSGCFVGCVRPCCRNLKYPFSQCPLKCRPKNHSDWTLC